MHPAVDEPVYVRAPRIGKIRKVKFLDVLPIPIVARFGKVLRPGVNIESVCQMVSKSKHMSARPAGRLENRDLVPSLHELMGTT